MEKRIERDFTTGPIAKPMFTFTVPIFLANMLVMMYALVDTLIVGRYMGTTGISAVTVGSQFMHLLTLVGVGFANGGQVVIARMKGIGSEKAQRESIGTLTTISFALGLIFSLIGVVMVNPALQLLNTPAEAFQDAKEYMFWTSLSMVFHFIFSSNSAVLRGLGDSKRPLVFISIATILNVILDILFVGPLHMRAAGAAIATSLSIATSAVCSTVYLYLKRKNFVFDFKLASFIPRKYCVKELARMGIPQVIQSAAIQISMSVVMAMINVYGADASATLGVGNRIIHLFIMPATAFSAAAGSMSAQNIGANKIDRARKIILSAFGLGMIFTVIGAVVMAVFPEQIVGIFDDSPEVIRLGSIFLRIHIVHNFALSTLQVFCAAALGVGNAILGSVGLLVDGVVLRLALSFLFRALGFGLIGFFWASSIAPVGAAVIFVAYYLSNGWVRYHEKHMNRLQEAKQE